MKCALKDEDLVKLYLSTRHNRYFETLYQRYSNKVYRRCLSLTKDPAQAEDYTHDIFLRVHGNLNRFQERSSFSTWLYSVSYNYCMDQLRALNKTTLVTLDSLTQEMPNPDETDYQEVRLHQLSRVLDGISLEETSLLRLKYHDNLDIKEIAQQYNLKDSAIKMRLKRTRDKVRRLYLAQSV